MTADPTPEALEQVLEIDVEGKVHDMGEALAKARELLRKYAIGDFQLSDGIARLIDEAFIRGQIHTERSLTAPPPDEVNCPHCGVASPLGIVHRRQIEHEAEQHGREGGIRDAIKVQDPYTAGKLAGKKLLAPYVRHPPACAVGNDHVACTCGLTAALKRQPKVTTKPK